MSDELLTINQPSPYHIFLVMPNYGGIEPEAVESMWQCSQKHTVTRHVRKPCSLLARSFNGCWTDCINLQPKFGFTHFAMIHSDVGADSNWLDTLIAEMDARNASIMSTIIPIKDYLAFSGMTSTAIYDPDTKSFATMSLQQCYDLPETFGINDVAPGKILATNTGLWVCKFTEPWVRQIHFEILDNISYNDKGEAFPIGLSEDWYFAEQAYRLGVESFATRKVGVDHYGRFPWTNRRPWGTTSRDSQQLKQLQAVVQE